MTKKKNTITLSGTMSLLVSAIKPNDNPAAVQLLIKGAIAAVYEKSELQVTDDEIDAVVCLIQSIEPKDTIEIILAAQIICSHLQGMNSMHKNFLNSKGQGLMLLRLSHQSLEQLQRYRGKLSQNINVTYNTLIKGGASKKMGDNS